MVALQPITHVIFDIDGLLLDTENIYHQAAESVCSKYGKTQTWDLVEKVQGKTDHDDARIVIDTETIYTEVSTIVLSEFGKEFSWEIKSKQMGKKEEDAAAILIEELQLPITVEEYLALTWKEQERMFPHTELMPGVEKLVRHLHRHGIPMGLATGSSEPKYDLKIRKHGELFSLFKHVVFSSGNPEVKHSKPAPDVFLVSASKFPDKPHPSKVLVFEDANNGVEGALNAGMQCVWIPDERADKSALQDKVSLLLRSMEEFKPEAFGLPPYDDEANQGL